MEPLRAPGPIASGPSDVSLLRRAMNGVQDLIRAGGKRPGTTLPGEAALALQFGVSRGIMREALSALAALGVVDVGAGRRPRVGAVDPTVLGLVLDHAVHTDQISIQQIYDVRRTIEMRTAALAARLRSAEEAAALQALADAMRAAFATPLAVMEHDIALHQAIARAGRNPLFMLIVDSFQVVMRKTWMIGWTGRASDAERMGSIEIHGALAAAIAAQDAAAAEAAMADHFDLTPSALLRAGIH